MQIEVTTHSGKEDIIQIEAYDPVATYKELENNDTFHILLAENIYSKVDVKTIKPLKGEVENV